jgi:pterin-4a-carbinolamine dehydratase
MKPDDKDSSVNNTMVRSYMLGSFSEAIEFVNDVAEIVESKNLVYPIITIEGNKVSIAFSSDTDVKHATKLIDDLYSISYSDAYKDEDELLRYKEGKDRARLRSRGPYRKSSGIGLR